MLRLDPFSFTSLTKTINEIPFVPGQVGEMGLFKEYYETTTTIEVEKTEDSLLWVSPSPRNGVGETRKKAVRQSEVFKIPHFHIEDYIAADEVQNIRDYGSETGLMSLQTKIRQRLTGHALSLDLTYEYTLLSALQGKIRYADGTVVDLFTKFGLQQPAAPASLQMASAGTDLIKKTREIERKITKAMKGIPFKYIKCFTGPDFWDNLVSQQSIKETYLNQSEASDRREMGAYKSIKIGKIIYEEYRGGDATPAVIGGGTASPLLPDDHGFYFPVSDFIYETRFAPAPYEDTVNTIAVARYANVIPSRDKTGRELDIRTCPLPINRKPDATFWAKI